MAGIKGFSEIELSKTEWGPLHILRALPRNGDSWGPLSLIKGTEWEPFIRVVSGEVLSLALHGYTKFLVEQIGPEPDRVSKRVPDSIGMCRRYFDKTCSIRKSSCRPGYEVPECYEVLVEDPALGDALYEVVMAWKNNRYVIVVEGPEFSF